MGQYVWCCPRGRGRQSGALLRALRVLIECKFESEPSSQLTPHLQTCDQGENAAAPVGGLFWTYWQLVPRLAPPHMRPRHQRGHWFTLETNSINCASARAALSPASDPQRGPDRRSIHARACLPVKDKRNYFDVSVTQGGRWQAPSPPSWCSAR